MILFHQGDDSRFVAQRTNALTGSKRQGRADGRMIGLASGFGGSLFDAVSEAVA
jgi:hypothetical protein